MALFLDRIDSVPVINGNFDTQLLQWMWVLVDTLNENINDIQDLFNILSASSYTAAEIADLESDGQLGDGVILYDTTNNVYVGRENGVLVKFTTGVYP